MVFNHKVKLLDKFKKKRLLDYKVLFTKSVPSFKASFITSL